MNVTGISGPTPSTAQVIAPTPSRKTGEFVKLLGRLVGQVNDKQMKAETTVKDLVAGKIENVHEIMLVEAEADISFRMLLQARNKLVEAYKEIMRMQI
jgi:flagellar hook-basal body complex protein FliE